MDFNAICNCCPSLDDCRAAFGKYWPCRSSNGQGCRHPFPGWSKGVQVLPTMPKRPVRTTQGEITLRPTRPMGKNER